MSGVQSFFAAVSAVVLFVYGLQGFSRELQAVGGASLRAWLASVTASRWQAFIVGALATAVVQSSSAVTSLTATLVDASVISFRASLGVLLGANVGTTATAWLVSFQLTAIGPFCIAGGVLLSALPTRVSIAGKSVFYFGLIFFALDLIAAELKPLREQAVVIDWLMRARSPWIGITFGLVITAVVQSSSVTAGVAILLVQQGALPAEAAIPIVVGSNVGSTSTALLASVGMSAVARATAKANLLFNVAGAIVFFPFLPQFASALVDRVGDAAMAVAWAHLIFNLAVALFFLLPFNRLAPRLQRWLLGDAT